MRQIRQKADPGIEIVLVGNKLDLVKDGDFTEGKDLAASYGIPFFVVSAKNGTNIAETFTTLTDMIISHNPKICKPPDNILIKEKKLFDGEKCCV